MKSRPRKPFGGPRGYASGKQRGGGAIDSTISATGDLMKCAKRETTARESRVDLGYPKGEHRFRAPAFAFDLLDLRAQRLYGGLGPHARS